MVMAESAGKQGLQILQTILVAVLLGATGWLGNEVTQTSKQTVRLETQLAERKILYEKLEAQVSLVRDTQQQVLRDIISMHDWDRQSREEHVKCEERLERLEKALLERRP